MKNYPSYINADFVRPIAQKIQANAGNATIFAEGEAALAVRSMPLRPLVALTKYPDYPDAESCTAEAQTAVGREILTNWNNLSATTLQARYIQSFKSSILDAMAYDSGHPKPYKLAAAAWPYAEDFHKDNERWPSEDELAAFIASAGKPDPDLKARHWARSRHGGNTLQIGAEGATLEKGSPWQDDGVDTWDLVEFKRGEWPRRTAAWYGKDRYP